MSLLTLLKVGNSFSPIVDHPSRYRMRRENLLPHFGDAESAAVVREPTLPGRGTSEAAATVTATAEPIAAGDLFDAAARALDLGSSRVSGAAAAQPAVPCAFPGGRWTRMGAASAPSAALTPTVGRVEARGEAVPVQRDLPWEDIPVARNDLSEGDLEVVPASRKAEPPIGLEPARKSKATPVSLLDRVKSQWVRGAGK
jgi:hypothetical protein